MSHGTIRVGLALAWIAFSGTTAFAQQQWLRYRTLPQARRIGTRGPGQRFDLTGERPTGVSLPEFASVDPLFGKWKTPMVPAGGLWLALDRSRKTGPYNRLYIDSDADRSLADETAVRPHRRRIQGGRQSAEFRQVKVLLGGADGPVAFHLDLSLSIVGSETPQLVATAGGGYEGPVKIGQREAHCSLFDSNGNGAFDDAYLDLQRSDQIHMDLGTTLIPARAGKYIQIEGTLYRLTIARDGSFVELAPPKDAVMGIVRVAEDVGKLSLGGSNGLLFMKVTDGMVTLPVGKYRVNRWERQRTDSAGVRWKLTGAAPAKATVLEVTTDRPGKLDLAGPILASVSARGQRGSHGFFNPKLTGPHGQRVTITRNGRRPPAPKLRIRNESGSYDRRFTFEYG